MGELVSMNVKEAQRRLSSMITLLYERGDLDEDELKEFEMIEAAIGAYVYVKENL
jgi:hypothetical protein